MCNDTKETWKHRRWIRKCKEFPVIFEGEPNRTWRRTDRTKFPINISINRFGRGWKDTEYKSSPEEKSRDAAQTTRWNRNGEQRGKKDWGRLSHSQSFERRRKWTRSVGNIERDRENRWTRHQTIEAQQIPSRINRKKFHLHIRVKQRFTKTKRKVFKRILEEKQIPLWFVCFLPGSLWHLSSCTRDWTWTIAVKMPYPKRYNH